jgi:hypothetical protein
MDAYNTPRQKADLSRRGAAYELCMKRGLPVEYAHGDLRRIGTDPLEDVADGDEPED